MPKNPLAEVFGFPIHNFSDVAERHRAHRLCPYHNSSGPNCTKFSVEDPLGVCSIHHGNEIVVTCPVRFRQDYKILADAGHFFFEDQNFVALTEVRLPDKNGKSAGNIDIVLAVLDKNKKVTDFGAIEVQAVYITGNIRNVFRKYVENPTANFAMEWPIKNYPKPDYLSSSRKRLAPQLIFKGGILKQWAKKMAVVVHHGFFEKLPRLDTVQAEKADIAWMIYELELDKKQDVYDLRLSEIKYTKFKSALDSITMPEIGDVGQFTRTLETRVRNGKLFGQPPESAIEPSVEPLEL